jgi:hypothetical protein
LPTPRDVIFDFQPLIDRIDLRPIDAIAGGGTANDAFTFIGAAQFSAAGQLRYETVTGGIYLLGDINGDGFADFGVQLNGIASISDSSILN